MRRNTLSALLLILLIPFSLIAQYTTQQNEDEKLKTSSVLMIGSGSAVIVGSSIMIGIGVHYIVQGTIYGGLIGSPLVYSNIPQGRILVSIGSPLFAGGLALIVCGARFRFILGKKRAVTLNTGYLDDGNIGIALKL